MQSTDLRALEADVGGRVVLPGDEAYAELSTTFVHQGAPAVIVGCRSAEDVRTALRFARTHALPVAVRSSGHNAAGFGTNDGGLVVDMSLIADVDVLDAGAGLVRLGSGARWIDVAAALAPHGLAISSGDTTSVAVGGLMLGGGIGWLVREHGLTIDSLQSAEVVTADGEILRASARENPDLFWAIRGGGGNFGVVTRFDVLARPLDGVVVGSVTFPAEAAEVVVAGWAAHMATAPDALTTTIGCFPSFGDAAPPLTVNICFAGTDVGEAERAIGPLLGLAPVLGRELRTASYPELLEEAALPPGWAPRNKNRFVADASPEFAAALVAAARRIDTLYVELRSLGGALGRVAGDATAFAHRNARVMVNVANLGTAAQNVEWAAEFDAFWRALEPFTSGAYSNLLSQVDPDDLHQVFPPATHARLAELKAKYDPENVFHHNLNIAPSAEEDGAG